MSGPGMMERREDGRGGEWEGVKWKWECRMREMEWEGKYGRREMER